MWLIIGLIIFLITFYIHKHTYTYRMYNYELKHYEYTDKVPSPLWLILLMIIISFIPILNIIFFVVGLIIYLINIVEEDIYLKPGVKLEKILNFFNKEI